jgi:Response regulator containing CheY-like receiver, AAA-type ATPase, and DNA-binding domains
MNRSILVVDDEIRFRELYARVLRDAGFAVQEAGSAAEALKLLSADVPAMVISDVRMPGASGLDLLRRARRASRAAFLLVTAYADVREAVDALKLGAVDYLAKPVDLDELLAAVATPWECARMQPGNPAEALTGIVSESPAMRSVLRDAYRVAASDATILLTGESGSGRKWWPSSFTTKAAAATSPWFLSTAQPSPRAFWPANCSAMKKAPSPEQWPSARDISARPMRERYFG